MIKKLNNKGLTVVEILICFALVSVIVISMFNVVNNYRDKQDLESYKTDIATYKNTVTKAIEEDIIANYGVKEVTIDNGPEGEFLDPYNFTKTITLTYTTEKQSTIKIFNKTLCFNKDPVTKEKVFGKKCPKAVVETTNEEDPEEEYANDSQHMDYKNSEYYIEITYSHGKTERFTLPKIYYLQYNSVETSPGTDEINPSGIVSIHVGLIHPDLGTNYNALNIITPNTSIYPYALSK